MKTALLSLVPALFFAGTGPGFTAEPTNDEQYMLELINRARANGNTEAVRLGLANVNTGNPAIFNETWTIQPIAPPLVWSEQLSTAARNHAQNLFSDNFLGGDPHNYEGTTPASRIAATGFVNCSSVTCPQQHTASGFIPGVENFGFAAVFGIGYTPAQITAEVNATHTRLFVDGDTAGRMHRITIMHTWFREIGLGLVSGNNAGGGRLYFMMDFGRASPGTQLFLTGVVYNDSTGSPFYTPGEGLGGIRVQAWQNGAMVAQTTTWASGGYRLPLAMGAYQIKMLNAAGGVLEKGTVSLTTENVKLDAVSPAFSTPPVPASVNLQVRRSGDNAVFTWDNATFSLAAADSLAGPWTVVATVSPANIPIQQGRRFFRAQK